tara:strand:- start:5404 stop:6147 length:744 start_codon:yes stop_codon:yes gene_type:complete
MHALIDSDIFCYEIGSMCNPDTGVPLPWRVIRRLVDNRIFDILDKTDAETWKGYLTGPGNFRFNVATIKPYKDHRGEKPFWYRAIYNYLHFDRDCDIIRGMEADDKLAIEQTKDPDRTIICSRDKDLRQVEGWHYIWEAGRQKEKGPFYVGELDGYKSFFAQCLTGDPVDNIPGLYKVGEKAASVQRVQKSETILEAFGYVREEYEHRFGSYWKMFLRENGRLLWMLRSEQDDWSPRMEELICQAGK